MISTSCLSYIDQRVNILTFQNVGKFTVESGWFFSDWNARDVSWSLYIGNLVVRQIEISRISASIQRWKLVLSWKAADLRSWHLNLPKAVSKEGNCHLLSLLIFIARRQKCANILFQFVLHLLIHSEIVPSFTMGIPLFLLGWSRRISGRRCFIKSLVFHV